MTDWWIHLLDMAAGGMLVVAGIMTKTALDLLLNALKERKPPDPPGEFPRLVR